MSFTRVAPGIYQDSRTGNFFERPTVAGKKTWRKLHGRTLKLAKEELAVRRTDQARSAQGLSRDPYAPEPQSIGELILDYVKADCPDRHHHPRAGKSLADELYRLESLKPFWHKKQPHLIRQSDCALYFTWRKKRIQRGHGGRAIDMELGALNSLLKWAVATGRTENNPLAGGRPRFRPKTIKHCRDFMPLDANELHALAAHFFEERQSEALGWQLLLEAMTGCRTSEILRMRWDARHRGEAGFIEGDWLWINRSKGGVKPFVTLHPALAQCLEALKRWRAWRYPKSPWWLPGRNGKAVAIHSLNHALNRASKLISNAHRTSHGLRAYYVTVRRSQGISDAQIADEIGDKTGAAIIVSTYGAVPPNWRGSAALSWLPTDGEPAWQVLAMPDNLVTLSNHGHNASSN
jgi:integrase